MNLPTIKMSEPKTIGQSIIDSIIASKLLSAHCATEPRDHTCIIVWSSGAEEQLSALCERWLNERQKKG